MSESTNPMHLGRMVGVNHRGEQNLELFSFLGVLVSSSLFASLSAPLFASKNFATLLISVTLSIHDCVVCFCLWLRWLPGASLGLSFALRKGEAGQSAVCSVAPRS